MKKALYLDDQRTPKNNPPDRYEPWNIVRNYDEFKTLYSKYFSLNNIRYIF